MHASTGNMNAIIDEVIAVVQDIGVGTRIMVTKDIAAEGTIRSCTIHIVVVLRESFGVSSNSTRTILMLI